MHTVMTRIIPDLDWNNYNDRLPGIMRYLSRNNFNDINRVALYGAGEYGRAVLYCMRHYLPDVYKKIVCVIDSNQNLYGKKINGIDICPLSEAVNKYKTDMVLITAPKYHKDIYESICHMEGSIRIGTHYEHIYEERITPNTFFDKHTKALTALPEHINRYYFALPYCIDKDALDIACGCGYGTNILASRAKSVIGADINDEAIDAAKVYFSESNTEFKITDATNFNINKSFDVIVSFETIEHLEQDATHNYLKCIKAHLRENGIFIVSTPSSQTDGVSRLNNPYHINEMTITTFINTISKHFDDIEYYVQDIEHKGCIRYAHTTDFLFDNDMNRCFIAVCYL